MRQPRITHLGSGALGLVAALVCLTGAAPLDDTAAPPPARPPHTAGDGPGADPSATGPTTPPDDATEASSAPTPVAEDDSDTPAWHPFGGSLLVSQSIGTGTFIEGPAARPYYNLAVVLKPHVVISEAFNLNVRARFGFDVNLVDNADSTRSYPRQVLVSDVRLGLSMSPVITVDFERWPTSDSSASLALNAWFDLVLPASLASQIATKYLGLRFGAEATFSPFDWLELGYELSVTKNFNALPNTVIDARDFSAPPKARAGDPAGVDTFLIATGAGVTEWGVGNSVYLSFSFLERLTLYVEFNITHAFTYLRDIPKDELSSPFAHANRGRSEVMGGTIELAIELMDHLSVAIGTVTEQTPYSLDGQTLRSPFWDGTNGATNRQVIYLDVTGTM